MISWPNQTLFLSPGKSVKRFGIFVLGGSGPKLFGLIIFVPAFIPASDPRISLTEECEGPLNKREREFEHSLIPGYSLKAGF